MTASHLMITSDPAISPWKPCDLRGKFPEPVSENLFLRVGRAIGSEIAKGARAVVGGDVRLSTPVLKAALIKGLASTGVHVTDVGQIPTPVVYFHANRVEAAALFVVTASHNPAADNGLKWMIGNRPPEPRDIEGIRKAAESGQFREGSGYVEMVDALPRYREWTLSRWSGKPWRNIAKIVLDAGNGAWSGIADAILRELGCDVECLFCSPDGSFPNRPPDCARTVNLAALRSAVLRTKASLGIAWDGDGDRVAFIDESGAHVSTDEISILLAGHVLKDARSREHVICDVKLSDAVRRQVLLDGGIPIIERSGHAFMRRRFLETDAILGLDACGHYFFRHGGSQDGGSRDDGLHSALVLLSMLNGVTTLGELRRSIPPIFSTPELRLPQRSLDFIVVRDRLRAAFPEAEESEVDGTRLALEEGVVLVRESSTEPVISMRIEGFSEHGYNRLVAHCLSLLPEVSELLGDQIGCSRVSGARASDFLND